ncbi:MAG: tetratricopeptide repeat protein [Proteobacteria bacterium]|nr:tetratricopeptide repeat protein [Pseudomonadota bacterium]
MLKKAVKTAKCLLPLLTMLAIQSCGPTQEELRIGALAHFRRGNQLFENHQPKAAVTEYRKAIALDPNQERIHYNLGLAYYSLVLYNQAIDSYWKAIERNPDFAEAWYNLSLAFEKIRETEKAFMAYEKYQTLNQLKDKEPELPETPENETK